MTDGPSRIVAVGDLNASFDSLLAILYGTGLIDVDGHWVGDDTQLVQLGDVFNRGDGAREIYTLLFGLQAEASAAGGAVHLLLGNHEVLTSLGFETDCTIGEYLSFATERQREQWTRRRRRQWRKLLQSRDMFGRRLPIEPRLSEWELENVPGKEAMRRALAPRGQFGRKLRQLPVAVRLGRTIFVHAGITPHWARRGLNKLNDLANATWGHATLYDDLPARSVLRSNGGPIWDRTLATGPSAEMKPRLEKSLSYLDADRMVVGHTPTQFVPGVAAGEIGVRHGGQLVCIDVGMSGMDGPMAALVIENGNGWAWTPEGGKVLWEAPEES